MIDGQYYTALDDEIYQVINLDELNWEHDTLAAQTSSGSRGSGNEVDLSNGKAYHGSVDISNTNFTTPTFIGYTKTSEKSILHTAFTQNSCLLINTALKYMCTILLLKNGI